MRYSIRLRLEKQSVFFGPGVEQLLKLVDETGSLQMAAARMEMSYSKAWKIVRHAEQELGFAVLERRTGGAGGGFSRLTPAGRTFLERYTAFQRELNIYAEQIFQKYFCTGDLNEKN